MVVPRRPQFDDDLLMLHVYNIQADRSTAVAAMCFPSGQLGFQIMLRQPRSLASIGIRGDIEEEVEGAEDPH